MSQKAQKVNCELSVMSRNYTLDMETTDVYKLQETSYLEKELTCRSIYFHPEYEDYSRLFRNDQTYA